MTEFDSDAVVDLARRVLKAEADAIMALQVDQAFVEAVQMILAAPEHASLVVTGLGKSGLIGQKLAATFASTGMPSHFVHATEASHGDLGRIRQQDVVLHLSNSGNTEEVVGLAEVLKQDGVKQIAITASALSDLGKAVDVVLQTGNVTEACPHNLAPTASTSAQLALGDALALCVSSAKHFGAEDFHRLHAGGGLGRLLRPVTEAMRFKAKGDQANLPLISQNASIQQAYQQASQLAEGSGVRRAGALVVIDEVTGKLVGIFTDGDLRRHVLDGGDLSTSLAQVMTIKPQSLKDDAIVRDAVRLVRERRIDEIPVVDSQGCPLGLIDVQDLVALKVIEG